MATAMTDEAGTIRIVLGGSSAGRLFGVPFLATGGWLGYHLIRNLIDFATGHAGPDMIPGTVVLAVVAAAFFLPGWMLLASRAVVEMDRVTQNLTVVRDLRFYKHRATRRLAEFSSLEVDMLTTSPNPSRPGSRAYQVELTSPDRRNQVVGLFDDGEAALAHGRRLSTSLGLPLEDNRFKERPSDE